MRKPTRLRPSNTNRRLTSPCCRQREIVFVETLNSLAQFIDRQHLLAGSLGLDIGRFRQVFDEQPQIVAGVLARDLQIGERIRAGNR